MRQDVNHAPFRSVSFIESSDKAEDKAAAFEQMNLAVLHLSAKDFLGDDVHHRFVDLKATGVFYEASVHAEQGEFVLSNALIEKIAHSKEPDFCNKSADYRNRNSSKITYKVLHHRELNVINNAMKQKIR